MMDCVLYNNKSCAGRISGSLCDSWSSHCYLLPVLDTVLVRRSRRRRGFGLQMLEDFCSSFSTETYVGVSSPLSPSMVAGQLRFSFILLSPPLQGPFCLFIYILLLFLSLFIFSYLEENFVRWFFLIWQKNAHFPVHTHMHSQQIKQLKVTTHQKFSPAVAF